MEPGHVQGYTDLPLSQRAGYPAAFYPHQGLAVHTQEQGWEIIS
jgi:phosphoserine phosphatase